MISINIILNRLAPCEPVIHEQDVQERTRFQSLRRLREGGEPAQHDVFYVSTLDRAKQSLAEDGQLWFCCPVKGAVEPVRHVIQVRGMDIEDLYEYLRSLFEQIFQWDWAMSQSIIDNEGIQRLLDLSEPILGNHIAVSDPSLKLVAYTKGIPPQDEISCRLVEQGYHGAETIAGFRAKRLFDAWSSDRDFIIVDHPEGKPPFQTIGRAYKCIEGYSLLAVMTMLQVPYSPGLRDLFAILTDRIAYYAERDYPSQNNYI